MVETQNEVMASHSAVPLLQNVSWGAILAGFFVAFGVQFTLEMLGLAIGATAFDAEATNGIGTGAVIWLAGSALLSLFAGGYTAARLSGQVDSTDGLLHGLATWALIVLINMIVLTFGATRLVGGITSFVGNVAQGGSEVATQLAPAAAEALPNNVGQEVQQAIGQQDAALEAILADLTNEVSAVDGNTELQAQEVRAAVTNFLVGSSTLSDQELQAARQEAVDALAANTTLSESEIQTQLDELQQSYQAFVDRAQAAIDQAADATAEAAASTGGILFAALFVGAVAAGMGGVVGTRKMLPSAEVERVAVERRTAPATGD